MTRTLHPALAIGLVSAAPALGQGSFVNWESPHVHPIDATPDGTRVVAVNTADNRLEVFAIEGTTLDWTASVDVGLDPVSVRVRTDGEAWVVNHVSDTVSIVDLDALVVVATLATGDEPADVVFAGTPQRAFVSVSQLNEIRVYDPADLAAAPTVLPLEGEDPRALATDGQTVYAAIFESGNGTTILPGGIANIEDDVIASELSPYADLGSPNPPPNSGTGFDPPMNPQLPPPPPVSLIVRKDPATGAWLDDNGGDWSPAVTWDLHDHDVAVIDANTLEVSYVAGLMNLNMAIAVRPGGEVVVVGTEAINEVRFEPNLNGVFVRVVGATIAAEGPAAAAVIDLNPHLDYGVTTLPQEARDQSIGDPRGLVWNAAGDTGYVSGMGSNNVVVVDGALGRVDRIEVGQGPTGLLLNEDEGVLYALDKFDGAISIVDVASRVELQRVPFYDPTPDAIRLGRPHLYDTHRTSGLGQTSCASCHVDGRMDQLAWDLGDPSGQVKPFDQNCNGGIPGGGQCEDFHPMKGPMVTQTLVGIIGTEPLHWRGDRGDLGQFNPAFVGLLGDDEQLTAQQMDEFEAFLATLVAPPNPYRRIFNSLQSSLPNGGNAVVGQGLYTTGFLDGVQCSDCHALPDGTNPFIISSNLLQESQSFKIPQLRNLYEKTGFDRTSMSNNRGFGFIHDGSVDTLLSFLTFDGFLFAGGSTGDDQRLDVEAFLLSLSTDTHAGIGWQTTFGGPLGGQDTTLRTQMLATQGSPEVGIIAKGLFNGERRGFYYQGGQWVSDRAAETFATSDLDDAVDAGGVITYTLVPEVAMVRMAVDRDEDGVFDRDELDGCADPADPESVPMPDGCMPLPGDVTGDGAVNVDDLVQVILDWGACPPPPDACPSDTDGSGAVDVDDLVTVLLFWG